MEHALLFLRITFPPSFFLILSTAEYFGSSSPFLAFFDPLLPLFATLVYNSPVGPAA